MVFMKIQIRKFKSGERYVFLLDDDGVPDFWVTHFVTQKLRMNKKANTIKQYLNDIKHLKRWEEMNGRDLLEEIYLGKLPDSDDIASIKEFCSYQVKSLKRKSKSKVVDMGKFYISKVKDLPTVGKNQYFNRVAHIAEFLHFIGKERVKTKPTGSQLFDELEAMKRELKADMPKIGISSRRPKKALVSEDAMEDFVEVAHPNSRHNPFLDPAIKFRNYLIVQTLYETGLRRSELLALRIGDIGTDTNYPTLAVVERENAKDDPRLDEPTPKTLGREVPISKGLRQLLNSYIKTYRAMTINSKTHGLVFVSHKGKAEEFESGSPLCKQTINDVFKRIKKVNPERFEGITPHEYRHLFNDQLSAKIDEEREMVKQTVKRLESEGKSQEAKQYANENTISKQRELEIRAELNGHSSFRSGETYLKRTMRKQASDIRRRMHAKLNKKAEV